MITQQIICNAPIHEFEGVRLVSDNQFGFNNNSYIPICFVNLNTSHLYVNEGNEAQSNEPSSSSQFEFSKHVCGNSVSQIPKWLRLYIDACYYC